MKKKYYILIDEKYPDFSICEDFRVSESDPFIELSNYDLEFIKAANVVYRSAQDILVKAYHKQTKDKL